uniref:Uncharacterized protein n=1 Tax=Vitrella brassicaformis TaxID=1169539 RepID=A0A7S1PAT7_9ALVE|mmetsp:Transcript_4773/g.11041  ORF Transcript_4773/g.11041 Transcript_4773/m.11041 type:complete len:149 (+) Transcript_4773:345-791(+)
MVYRMQCTQSYPLTIPLTHHSRTDTSVPTVLLVGTACYRNELTYGRHRNFNTTTHMDTHMDTHTHTMPTVLHLSECTVCLASPRLAFAIFSLSACLCVPCLSTCLATFFVRPSGGLWLSCLWSCLSVCRVSVCLPAYLPDCLQPQRDI